MPRKASSKAADSGANLGFEAKLWLAAGKLRNNLDAAEPVTARQTAAGSPQGERGGASQRKAAHRENVGCRSANSKRQPIHFDTRNSAFGIPSVHHLALAA